MKEIYKKISNFFESNTFSVLATIIDQSGSSPRSMGAKMLIMEDGSSVGSVGGGLLEANVIKQAKNVFMTNSPVSYKYHLQGKDVEDEAMICGGDVEVFLEPVSADIVNHVQIFKKTIDVINRGGSGILATVVDSDQWHPTNIPKMFLRSDGEKTGSLLGILELEESLLLRMDEFTHMKKPGLINCRDMESNILRIFIEPVISDPILYIFGGGHISRNVVPIAAKVGFKTVVIDDRPDIAHPDNFPDAAEVLNYSFEGIVEKLDIMESSYMLIVTRGHAHDKTVLAQALRTNAGYIGMIGSKRKIAIIYEKLLDEGFTEKDLERVYSPVGLPIGAETPEEIAVSIVSELIKVRAGI